MTLDGHTDQSSTRDLTQALNQLWARFLPEIRERAERLADTARACNSGTLTEELRESAHAAAHKLAGTLGTFNLERGTELAREFEQATVTEERCKSTDTERLAAIAAEIRTIIDERQ